MKKQSQPNYKRIYSDIIDLKFPHKKAECEKLLEKKMLTALDILELNNRIFGTKDQDLKKMNQKLRSYNEEDILRILQYQKNHNMNNLQVAERFGLSRNTMTKWRRLFQ
ncbi:MULTISPECIES: helix-turn-helix domain-containing protein [Chryseobacterium]|uniref:Helix-turn-helix domain-containing protein n=2 Tax=Chryseobacterium bernardetii TaxID=1241978 RepID=A0A3G6TL21_9FLAO|nr:MULTISPECIES: helix-turn-helix domain-containing protein [Chryseobacterium]AZB26994.1 helix-turn-helix domain-containing protein [Chryseobacterium bernardetii]UCA61206.1 helix-turn-helix domain-containing protein [Chryseobacterium rhizoplanae]